MIVRLLMADCHPPQCHLRHSLIEWLECYPILRPGLPICHSVFIASSPSVCFPLPHIQPSQSRRCTLHIHLYSEDITLAYKAAEWVWKMVAMAAHSELGCCMIWGAMLLTSPLFSTLHCCLIAADLSGNTKWNSVPCTLALYISAFKPSVSYLIYNISVCMRLKIQQLDVFTR